MNEKKHLNLKPCQLYALIFFLVFGINQFFHWWNPDGWEIGWVVLDGLGMAVCITAGFIMGDRKRRRNQKFKDKVEELLKNNA